MYVLSLLTLLCLTLPLAPKEPLPLSLGLLLPLSLPEVPETHTPGTAGWCKADWEVLETLGSVAAQCASERERERERERGGRRERRRGVKKREQRVSGEREGRNIQTLHVMPYTCTYI